MEVSCVAYCGCVEAGMLIVIKVVWRLISGSCQRCVWVHEFV